MIASLLYCLSFVLGTSGDFDTSLECGQGFFLCRLFRLEKEITAALCRQSVRLPKKIQNATLLLFAKRHPTAKNNDNKTRLSPSTSRFIQSSLSAMVVQGAFRVTIVEANSKVPFPEHEKDGVTYVEAEKDAEYFVSIQKIGKLDVGYISVSVSVDGKDLGFTRNFRGSKLDSEPIYRGLILENDGGGFSYQALKFVTPRTIINNAEGAIASTMGHLKVHVKRARIRSSSKAPSTSTPSNNRKRVENFQNVEMTELPSSSTTDKKKLFRSGVGTTQVDDVANLNKATSTLERVALRRHYIKTGATLDTITINYASVSNLIKLGIVGQQTSQSASSAADDAVTAPSNEEKATAEVIEVTPDHPSLLKRKRKRKRQSQHGGAVDLTTENEEERPKTAPRVIDLTL